MERKNPNCASVIFLNNVVLYRDAGIFENHASFWFENANWVEVGGPIK